MKKPLLIILLLAVSVLANAQQAWQWAKQADYHNPKYSDEALGLAIDPSGSLYIAGYFQDSVIIFGMDTLVNTNAFEDAYLAKYDANGNALWAKRMGGPNSDMAMDVATDATGNIYVTGMFKSPQVILGTDTLHNSGAEDVFVVKFDAAGNILWAKSAGGTSTDVGEAVSTDSAGNVYVSGFVNSSPCAFDSLTIYAVSFKNMFLAKYTSGGNVVWAQNPLYDGAPYAETKKHNTDKAGNMYVAGRTVAGSVPGPYVLAKYDTGGNLIWTKTMTGVNEERTVRTDNFGNVYVIGYFYQATATFDTVTFYNTALTTSQCGDMYVLKYDAGGNLRWAKKTIGTKYEWGTAVSIDKQGTVYVTGAFTSAIVHFDSIAITKPDSVYESIFLAAYDSAGNIQMAVNTTPSGSYNIPHSICNDALGNAYLVGSYSSDSISFGAQKLINPVGQNLETDHSYLARWGINMTTANAFTGSKLYNMLVYPNPGKGLFRIKADRLIRGIEIIDLAGKILFRDKLSSSDTEVDLTQYARGIYCCKVTLEGGMTSCAKIVVE